MITTDVLVVSPFRRPDFRHAVSPSHPFEEPWDSPPFVTAAACEAAGHRTAILALQNVYAGFDEAEDMVGVRELLSRYNSGVVIFTGDHFIASRSTATFYGIDIISKLIRERSDALIGVCGRLATTTRERLLMALPKLDFLVIGESEQVLGEVVTIALVKGAAGLAELSYVITRDSMTVRSKVEPAYVADPNALPLPAFHLAGPSVDLLAQRRMFQTKTIPFSVRTSFGCKFRCRFCAGVPHWTDYRTKSGERIAAEIDHLYASLPGLARLSFLEDEIATRRIDHVRALAKVLGAHGIRLDGLYTHSTLLTAEVAELLSPVVDKVFLGLDNPQDEVLRRMGKGQRLDTVLAAVGRAHAAGLRTHLEWIIGSPPETVDSLITSLHAIFTLVATGAVDSINTYVFCPHPGTEYAENATEHGLTVYEQFEMLESGGYPAASTADLSRQQIFTAYLISQLLITEVYAARQRLGTGRMPRPPARVELARLFTQVGGQR
jgi:anaerobic magnesium-protoporphyrin IX monomethyl ester cyclase